jgi:voltage-gated potassium channel Kch
MSETNNTTVENTPVSRTITIYATRGNSEPVDIVSNATTWGDFIPEVKAAGYNIDKVLCTESHTRMDLVNKLAILPTVDFTIFIRNKETKSGAELSYKELRAAISGFIAADGDVAKEHFNQGKNYTTKPTEELRLLHDSYSPAKQEVLKEEATQEVVEAVETNVADVVESVAQAKVIIVTNTDRITKIELLLSQIKEATPNEEISDRIEMVMDEVAGLRTAIENDTVENLTEETVEKAVTNTVDPAEEGRLKAVEEARLAEEAKIADEKKAENEAKEIAIARKKKLADEAKALGL